MTAGGRDRRTIVPLAVAAAAGIVSIALLWSGVATYDGVEQYRQATANAFDDWHPPIMARLWQALIGLGLPGTGPMLALQLALYWLGFGLLAAALARTGARRASVAALVIGLSPLPLDWMACVLKDCQLLGALVAASGIVAWFRLQRRAMPGWAIGLVAILLGYAALARANSVFAVVPLVLCWAGWCGCRRPLPRLALLLAGMLGVIALSGPINHRLLGAERSHVERTLPLFDMAGIAHRTGLATLPGLPIADWRHAEATHCYTPFFWDPMGDATKCGTIGTQLAFDRDDDAPSIFGQWAALIAAHPLAYVEHRAAHLNATLRIAEPADERLATAPALSLPNAAGIGEPVSAVARPLAIVATAAAATPLGVPAVWLVLAGGLWWTLLGATSQPARDLGIAAAASACLQTASFAIVSIASDLRYHLWLMTGTAIAAVLLAACRDVPRRRLVVTIAATLAAAFVSVVLRAQIVGQPG